MLDQLEFNVILIEHSKLFKHDFFIFNTLLQFSSFLKNGKLNLENFNTAAAEYIIDNYNGFINTSSINDIKNSMEKYILDKELIIKHGKRNFDLKKDVSYEYMINKYNKAIFED